MEEHRALIIQKNADDQKVKALLGTSSIGRLRDSDFYIDDATVSRRHAKIIDTGQQWLLEDLGSRAGTKLNGKAVTLAYLTHGDKISIGKTTLKFIINPKYVDKQALVVKILFKAIESKATDVMLKNAQPAKLMVKRQYKKCPGYDQLLLDKDLEEALKVLLPENMLEDNPEESHFTVIIDKYFGVRFRLHAYRQQNHWSLLFRYVKSNIPSLSELKLPTIYSRVTDFKQGLILLAGAPNSGKTTTLASMLQMINQTREGRILTIEDPVEFNFIEDKSVIDQIEVGVDVANYEEARMSLVRQNPEVVFIGELRDHESLETALQGAASGQLVFATLHALNIGQVLPRMNQLMRQEDQERLRHSLAAHLKAVFCQKLLPTLHESIAMVPCVEYLIVDPGAKLLIERGMSAELADYLRANPETSKDFNRDLQDLVKDNWISKEVALSHSSQPEQLSMNLLGIELNSEVGIIGEKRRV